MFYSPVLRRASVGFSPRAADLALQRFLQDTLRTTPATARTTGVQAQQDDKATTLQLDVPGLAREQLDIQIEGAVVRVRSTEGAARTVNGAWELPEPIDAAASKARLEHGVLTLTLARTQPADRSTRLAVE